MPRIPVVLLTVGALILSACQPAAQPDVQEDAVPAAAEVKTMFVGPERVDCTGVAPMQCLQVAAAATGPWTNLYQPIEGFTHEAGYLYELKVRIEPVANPPADGSSLRYILEEEVSKTAAGEPSPSAAELSGTWNLVSYGSVAAPTLVPDGVDVTATFADGMMTGRSGCNQYGATYTLDGATITITPGPTTQMMCPEPVMAVEQAYLAALGQVVGYRLADGQLMFSYGNGQALVFEPGATSLAGTSWDVTGYNNGQQAVVSLVLGSTIRLRFAADKVSGKACNAYMGGFTQTADTITVGPLATTRMACPEEGVMEQEQRYLTALGNAASWAIDGSQLTLRDAAGAIQVSATSAIVTE